MSASLAFIGIGHIGGSMAAGLRAAGAARVIHGHDSDPAALELARELDLIDVAHSTPEAAAEKAELIVLATPPAAIADLCRRLAPRVSGRQTVTDVGSVKRPPLRALERARGEVPPWFVPGHPIAGTEKSGARLARGDLFRGRRVVLTPAGNADPEKVERIRWMWERLDARVERMSADAHDALFAGISHLPHMLAYALMDVLGARLPAEDLKRYAAGGLLDFTRIASSNPDLWLDICRSNRAHLTPILERFEKRVGELAAALRDDRSDALRDAFAAAKRTRDALRPNERE